MQRGRSVCSEVRACAARLERMQRSPSCFERVQRGPACFQLVQRGLFVTNLDFPIRMGVSKYIHTMMAKNLTFRK